MCLPATYILVICLPAPVMMSLVCLLRLDISCSPVHRRPRRRFFGRRERKNENKLGLNARTVMCVFLDMFFLCRLKRVCESQK